jgi:nucleoid-associated protein YgaU
MSDFVEYIVKDGERWDTIAQKAYGNPALYEGIIEANQSTVISPILTAGTRLKIPILNQAEIEIDSELLPPWKR